MTRVDFYILKDVDQDAARRFACRLALKAVANGHPVHVHTDGAAAADVVDELLWQYPEHRFLPHECETARTGVAPVVIGWSQPDTPDGLMINLADEVPGFFGRFERVAEIVVQARRDVGRERYRFYRDRGYPLFHHEMDDWEKS
ncbi:MAG: DNA polymerase III subunit chi [Pseudomonadales bacterium]|nr:DNA polymerase III subunit chi [Pseudomonadales bacterium]